MGGSELQYPVLIVSVNGSPVDRRPAMFRLMTDQAVPAVTAQLSYPAEVSSGASGDEITVSLCSDDTIYLLFTGTIYDARRRGAYRCLSLTDGYKNLCDTEVMPAYRKEKAQAILQDILDAAGITGTNITCPDIILNRFSTERISADRCIRLLIHALSEYGETGIRYFFDAENIFRFGTGKDTGKNNGPVFNFKTGKHIIERGDGRIEILPLPVRHSQNITVDGAALETVRTEMTISPQSSRLTLWLRGEQ
jgi:hypothetical protein